MIADGFTVSGYRLERLLGRGGMGAVFVAVNERLGRQEALKVLHSSDPPFRARFEREARLAASVGKHPNLVTIFNAGIEGDVPWLAMELIRGENLREVLQRSRGRLEAEEALVAVRAVAEGLDHLHAHGIVHRDVKPENIMIPSGQGMERAALTDFGIARRVGGGGRVTVTGEVAGTCSYVAPELLSGADVDGRADQYGLACVLVEVLTGAPVALGGSVGEILAWHLRGVRPKVSERSRLLPAALDAVVIRALEVDPGERWPSCSAFAEAAIEAFLPPSTPGLVGEHDSRGVHEGHGAGESARSPWRSTLLDVEATARPSVGKPASAARRRGIVFPVRPRGWVKGAAAISVSALVMAIALFQVGGSGFGPSESGIRADFPGLFGTGVFSSGGLRSCKGDGLGKLSCSSGNLKVEFHRYGNPAGRDAAVEGWRKVDLVAPRGAGCTKNAPIDVFSADGGYFLVPRKTGYDLYLISVGVPEGGDDEFWDWWANAEILGC